GYFVEPTILEHVGSNDDISRSELFGPITCLYRVSTFEEAIALANDSPFGLTASIHTQSLNRAMTFLARIQSGVAVVNGGTYGSEPHPRLRGLRTESAAQAQALLLRQHSEPGGVAACVSAATPGAKPARSRSTSTPISKRS